MGSTVFPAPASGPTLAEITTAIQSNSASTENWALISSASASYDTATITFSGLSGYKKYKLITSSLSVSGGGGYFGLRINSDTANTYSYLSRGINNANNGTWSTNYGSSGYIYLGESDTNTQLQVATVTISNANINAPKEVEVILDGNQYGRYNETRAFYRTSSSLNAITFFRNTGTLNGTVYLYGAN